MDAWQIKHYFTSKVFATYIYIVVKQFFLKMKMRNNTDIKDIKYLAIQ